VTEGNNEDLNAQAAPSTVAMMTHAPDAIAAVPLIEQNMQAGAKRAGPIKKEHQDKAATEWKMAFTRQAVAPAIQCAGPKVKHAYRTSPIKRARRSCAEMDSFLAAIKGILDGEDDAITIRHLFYRLVGIHQIEKTEKAYRRLCAHLAKWRRSGDITYSDFADGTRWYLGSDPTFNGVGDALANSIKCYRRNLWEQQSAYVEIWAEKDAISGILGKAASEFGVKVFPCRGFPSLTALHSSAESFKLAAANGKNVFIYYFGDHDPSGLDIDRSIGDSFRNDFAVDVRVERLAVKPEQITLYNLPTRPVKKSDSRARGWQGGGCVEVDAMQPAVLKGIVRDCIKSHIDPYQWEQAEIVEKAEKETLGQFVSNFRTWGYVSPQA
jgi:hypothetical protein